LPNVRIRGTQTRLPRPRINVLKQRRYVISVELLWKYLVKGTTATLKLLALTVARKL
jgi:hypothetical protein